MSYNGKRKKNIFDLNSSEPFKLSRSKIDLFWGCPRCFYLDAKLGLRRPDSYPLTLNIAVDHLLKKEFDIHRANKAPHPMMRSYKIDAIPYDGEGFNKWREVDFGRGGIHFLYEPSGFDVYGAIDDVWINKDGELIVVDYKATAKKDTPTLEGSLGEQYKRQMEVYQWLLKKNGHEVSKIGYFVYVNGKKDAKAFDEKLEFDVTIVPCEGNTDWIEDILGKIKECLIGELPAPSSECDYCEYRKKAAEAASNAIKSRKIKELENKSLF
jgi:hypothetical protein